MSIAAKDISEKKSFSRCGYNYQCIYYNQDFHCGVWKMTNKNTGRFGGYEVIKGVKYRQPDGSIVYRYPGDEQFGVYGFYSYNLDRLLKHIDEWMELD